MPRGTDWLIEGTVIPVWTIVYALAHQANFIGVSVFIHTETGM